MPNLTFIPALMRAPVLRWSLVILAAALCLAVFWPKPAALPEVPASELTLRDGLLYHGDQPMPFAGAMVENFPNGELKSRSAVRGGVLEGLSEGWHANGRIQIREIFKNGVSHGLREKWYEDGTKMSEGAIAEGKHEGWFRRWHENGVLAEEVMMRHGEPDGLSRAFYPSGFLKAEATLQNGTVLEQRSWADGEEKANPALASSK
jgi:antitoxin component YwqK of YwqJK toxin-antitoxin module